MGCVRLVNVGPHLATVFYPFKIYAAFRKILCIAKDAPHFKKIHFHFNPTSLTFLTFIWTNWSLFVQIFSNSRLKFVKKYCFWRIQTWNEEWVFWLKTIFRPLLIEIVQICDNILAKSTLKVLYILIRIEYFLKSNQIEIRYNLWEKRPRHAFSLKKMTNCAHLCETWYIFIWWVVASCICTQNDWTMATSPSQCSWPWKPLFFERAEQKNHAGCIFITVSANL